MKSFYRCGLPPFLPSVLLALLLALPACQRPEEPTAPADLLSREKMVPLMADLHILETQVENSRLPPDSGKALFREQQHALFWRRQVSDSAFQRSYRYYSVHNKDLNEVYQAVIDTLGQREKKFPAAPGSPPPPPAHH